ncbi:MAG: tetratricopeptide repeat protein [Candidatus Desulfofervidaceae bacterium]|nr:tetratricopeptide repeat protein [Candidatus Desulfofervidaceae bacterium]
MIQKVYLKLSPETPLEDISHLFHHLRLFSDIYVFIEDPSQSFTYLFNLTREISAFLQKYSFCRLNLHLIHSFSPELKSFYLTLTQLTSTFNIEGYTHQGTPRLIVFPILLGPFSEQKITPFLEFLEGQFMPPSLFVTASAYASIPRSVERVFVLSDSDPIVSLGQQQLLLDILEMDYPNENLTSPCPLNVVIDPKGNIFPCFRAYQLNIGMVELKEKGFINRLFPPAELCAECKYKALLSAGAVLSQEDQGELHFRLGLSYFDKAEIEPALKHFSQALNLVSPDDRGEIYFYLALCKANMGDYPTTIAYLKKANIWNYNAYFYLGFAHFQEGNYLEAKEALEKALALEPPLEEKLPIALYLATVYKELGQYSEAISLLQQMSWLTPEVREIYNLMGTCYYKSQKYSEAAECFEKAISLAPDSAIDYANLCLSLKAMGKTSEAISHCQKALALDSSLDFARKALKELIG